MTSTRQLVKRQRSGHRLIKLGKNRSCSRCPRFNENQGLLVYSCTCGMLRRACVDCAHDHFKRGEIDCGYAMNLKLKELPDE